MAEEREFLVRDPNAVGAQQSLVALAAVKDFYAADADPGAVGAGSVWKDTASSNAFRERNAADDGWDARFAPLSEADADADATVTATAVASGLGNAYAGSAATAADGVANAGSTATTTDGLANAQPSAITTTGSATAGPLASATDGEASAGAQATTTGVGTASVRSVATAGADGEAQAGSYAVGNGVVAGMSSGVFAGVAYLGFNAAAGSPIPVPAITGSRGGNAALASLLTQLAALGLITDGTS